MAISAGKFICNIFLRFDHVILICLPFALSVFSVLYGMGVYSIDVGSNPGYESLFFDWHYLPPGDPKVVAYQVANSNEIFGLYVKFKIVFSVFLALAFLLSFFIVKRKLIFIAVSILAYLFVFVSVLLLFAGAYYSPDQGLVDIILSDPNSETYALMTSYLESREGYYEFTYLAIIECFFTLMACRYLMYSTVTQPGWLKSGSRHK